MTKTDADRLLRAAVTVLAKPGWASQMNRLGPLEAIVEAIAPGRVERARATVKRQALAKIEAARWAGPVPAWAKRLTNKYDPNVHVMWRPSGKPGSSGHYQHSYLASGVITISAGDDEVDRRRVLLHELAHARTPLHGHDDTFWDECYRLAVAEGMVESMKERHTQRRSFVAAQRRARRDRSA